MRANKNKILPKYAILVFKSINFINECKRYEQKAVNQSSINITNLKKVEMPLPSIQEQQKIINGLAKKQALIDKKQKEIKKNKAIFKYWY